MEREIKKGRKRMNTTDLQQGWQQVRDEVEEVWSKLTEEDSHVIDTNLEQVVELLQERYGHTRDEAAKMLAHRLDQLGLRQADVSGIVPNRLRQLPSHKLWLLGGAALSFLLLVRFVSKLVSD
jgi:uncharacterized protein YjbJ (UPF0337 family)